MGKQKQVYLNHSAASLCKMLSISQVELLNILVERFGDKLIWIINEETLHHATPKAVRQWIKNNTQSPRRIIAHEIKAARYRAGLTQQQLAISIGLTDLNLICRLEAARKISPDRVQKIAEILQDDRLNQVILEQTKNAQKGRKT